MTGVLLDTHVWAWSLISPTSLSPNASDAITSAQRVCVSTISLFEIAQKVRLGKWDAIAPYVDQLINLAEEQRVSLLPVSSRISIVAATLDWPHRDPFDRLICATALEEDLVLISADSAFDGSGVAPVRRGRIW